MNLCGAAISRLFRSGVESWRARLDRSQSIPVTESRPVPGIRRRTLVPPLAWADASMRERGCRWPWTVSGRRRVISVRECSCVAGNQVPGFSTTDTSAASEESRTLPIDGWFRSSSFAAATRRPGQAGAFLAFPLPGAYSLWPRSRFVTRRGRYVAICFTSSRI